MGDDGLINSINALTVDFNPRPPCGGRPGAAKVLQHYSDISIHVPRTGTTFYMAYVALLYHISIHIPRTGTTFYMAYVALLYHISIHIPRTGDDRQTGFYLLQVYQYFNPRPPHGGRHVKYAEIIAKVPISIHVPRTGDDAVISSPYFPRFDFNPRPPHGGRHLISQNIIISGRKFQSTSPVRGTTASD